VARKKNLEKRNEILRASYKIFGEEEYNLVYLKDIAEAVGISKALMQHYFAKKSDLIECILSDILESSFNYIEANMAKETSVYVKLSNYTRLFLFEVINDAWLYNIISNSVVKYFNIEMWVDVVHRWLQSLSEKLPHDENSHMALSYSLAGGLQLLTHHMRYDIDSDMISDQMMSSFMRIMDCRSNEIQNVLDLSNRSVNQSHHEAFHRYCLREIDWYSVS